MSHSHHVHKEPNKKNLLISVLLNATITLAEFVGGIISNSLALLSDAVHNLSDTMAIIISYIAMIIGFFGRISRSRPNGPKSTASPGNRDDAADRAKQPGRRCRSGW